jgi:cytochrome P450
LVIDLVGPIVRISPNIVHINDPEYIDHVFAGSGKKREKGQQTINGLAGSPTVLGTTNHDLHRSRRAAISPFFSKQNIRRLEPTIVEIVQLIFQRFDEHIKSGLPLNLSLLFRATTHDIISNYAFGEGIVNLRKPDLNQPYFDAYHQMVLTWHLGCYFPWIGQFLRNIPPAAVTVIMPTAKTHIETIQVRILNLPLYVILFFLHCHRRP